MNGCAHAAFAHQLAAPGGDRRDYVLDLTGLIARSRHFVLLRTTPIGSWPPPPGTRRLSGVTRDMTKLEGMLQAHLVKAIKGGARSASLVIGLGCQARIVR